MEVRSLGFQTDLMVRRLSGSTVLDRGDHLVVQTPLNPFFYWGNFLLIPPPGRSELERWIGVFEADFPEAGHIALGIDGVDGSLGDLDLSPIPGLEPDVAEVMTADGIVGPGSLPPAAILRELHSDDDWVQVLELRTVLLGRRVLLRLNIGCLWSEESTNAELSPRMARLLSSAPSLTTGCDRCSVSSPMARGRPDTRAWKPTRTTAAAAWPAIW